MRTHATIFAALLVVAAAVAVPAAAAHKERHQPDERPDVASDARPDDDEARGYRHAFGGLDNETRAEAKAEWRAAPKGMPAWVSALVAKVRGDDAEARGASAENRHRGFEIALQHVPSHVAEKLQAVLDGLLGKDKADDVSA